MGEATYMEMIGVDFLGVLSQNTSLVNLTCTFKTTTIGEGENVDSYIEP